MFLLRVPVQDGSLSVPQTPFPNAVKWKRAYLLLDYCCSNLLNWPFCHLISFTFKSTEIMTVAIIFLNNCFMNLISSLVCLFAQVSSKIPTLDWLRSKPALCYSSLHCLIFSLYPYLWLPTYRGAFCFIQVEPSILPWTCHMYFSFLLLCLCLHHFSPWSVLSFLPFTL